MGLCTNEYGDSVKYLSLGILSCSIIWANPSSMNVISGSASTLASDTILQITASDRAVLEWNEFSNEQNETICFIQPDSAAAVLNRITGENPSVILGRLESNGKVLLINPNGVVFGAHSSVNVQTMIATTFDVFNSDFLEAKQLAFKGNSKASVQNAGHLCAHDIYLAGHSVENSGKCEASGFAGMIAAGGWILGEDCFKSAFRHPEMRQSKTIMTGSIKAPETLLLGDFILLESGARIDASSDFGGGKVWIGGDYQGKSLSLPNAKQTHIDASVRIYADALKLGDGGRVIIWGEEAALFRGNISACGGPEGGNGGFIEVSGAYLEYQGLSDLRAPLGKAGNLLLDPDDILINGGPTPGTVIFGVPTALPASATVNILNTDLTSALALGNVTLDTSVGGALAPGDITVVLGFPVGWGTGNFLHLVANRNITVNAAINCTVAGGEISLTAGQDIAINADVYNTGPSPGANVSAFAGRDITVTAGGLPVVFGNLFGVVTTEACGSMAITGGTAGMATAIIGSRGASNSGGAVGTSGDVNVNVGENLFIQAGGFGTNINHTSAGISRKDSATSTNALGNINVNVRGNATLSSGDVPGGANNSSAAIGLMNDPLIPTLTRYIGNINVNVGGTLTLAANGVPGTAARSYVGGLSNYIDFRSIITVDVGLDLVLTGRILPPSMSADPAWGQASHIGNIPLPANRDNLSVYINVGRDLYMNSTRCGFTAIYADNRNTDIINYPPELFIHAGGNIVLLAGSRPSDGSGAAAILYQSPPAGQFSTQIWAGGNIVCLNSTTRDASLNLAPTALFTNIGNIDVRSGGDITNGGGIVNQNFTSFNGTIVYESDFPFSSGQLWTPKSVIVCGSDIFAGTARGIASSTASTSTPLATGGNGLGAIFFDTSSYNNDAFNTITLTSPQLIVGTLPLAFTAFGDISMLSQAAYNNATTANFELGFGGSQTSFISNTGNIVIQGFNNINISGNGALSPALDATTGNVLVNGQNSLSLSNNALIQSGQNTILVSDNQFPSPPFFGAGGVTIDATSQINYGGALRIFTAFPSQNSINPLALFNGLTLAQTVANLGLAFPGLFLENSLLETYCSYYNPTNPFDGSAIGGFPFTVFYKTCLQLIVQQAEIVVTQFLVDLHPFNEYPGWCSLFYLENQPPPSDDGYQLAPIGSEKFMLRRRNLKVVNHPKSYSALNIFFGR